MTKPVDHINKNGNILANVNFNLTNEIETNMNFVNSINNYRWVPLKPDFLGAWKSVRLISNPAYLH